MPILKIVDAKSQGTAENLADYRPLDEYVLSEHFSASPSSAELY
jgi:hypothetical protein